jgi:hypothetical protein
VHSPCRHLGRNRSGLHNGQPRPYLSTLATSSFDVRHAQLAPAQDAIRSLSGAATFNLSLGTLEAGGDTRRSTTPIALDVGLTNRFAIGIVVPYIETRNNAKLILNRDGTSATIGQNPAFSATAGAAARTANGTLLRQIDQARTLLAAEITRCAVPGATGCDAIRANAAAAQQLVQRAAETQSAIVTVYGDSVRAGSPVVPISGSATQAAINTRLGALRTEFESFGVTSMAAGSLPAPATIVNGPGAIARIVGDTAYGLDYKVLDGTRRSGIGDIDLTASFLWLNTLGARPAQWLGTRRPGLRSLVTAGWRFGTAGADRPSDALDVPIGDGANALLLRSTTDIVFNRWIWISGTLRVVQPLDDQIAIRRPLIADSSLFFSSVSTSANRTLGRRAEIEIAPRLSIGQFFGISGGYLLRRQESDEYRFAADATLPERRWYVVAASIVSRGCVVLHTFELRTRTIKWPVEVMYVHTEPLAGTGTVVPAAPPTDSNCVYTGFRDVDHPRGGPAARLPPRRRVSATLGRARD